MYQEIFEDVYLPSVNALETIDYKIMGIINIIFRIACTPFTTSEYCQQIEQAQQMMDN